MMEDGPDARAVETGAESTRPKVYLVYFGWYSDYSIHGVFSNRAAAENLRQMLIQNTKKWMPEEERQEAFQVLEFTVYDSPEEVEGVRMYSVKIDMTGNEQARYDWPVHAWRYHNGEEEFALDISDDVVIGFSLRGYDAALRMARERLAQRKARDGGIA